MFFEAEKCFWLVIQNRVGNKPVEICSEEYKASEGRVSLATIVPLKCKWIIPGGKQLCQDYRKCKFLSAMFYICAAVKLERFTFCSGIIPSAQSDFWNRMNLSGAQENWDAVHCAAYYLKSWSEIPLPRFTSSCKKIFLIPHVKKVQNNISPEFVQSHLKQLTINNIRKKSKVGRIFKGSWVIALNKLLIFKNLYITPSFSRGKDKPCTINSWHTASHPRLVPAPTLRLAALCTPKEYLSNTRNFLVCISPPQCSSTLQGDWEGKQTSHDEPDHWSVQLNSHSRASCLSSSSIFLGRSMFLFRYLCLWKVRSYVQLSWLDQKTSTQKEARSCPFPVGWEGEFSMPFVWSRTW